MTELRQKTTIEGYGKNYVDLKKTSLKSRRSGFHLVTDDVSEHLKSDFFDRSLNIPITTSVSIRPLIMLLILDTLIRGFESTACSPVEKPC